MKTFAQKSCVRERVARTLLLTAAIIGGSSSVAAGDLSTPKPGPTGLRADVATNVGVVGFTSPSRKATLTVTTTGRVVRFLAEEGDTVRAGDVLVRLDDAVQRSRTEFARIRSECELEIQLARVKLQRAVEDLERLEELPVELQASTHDVSQARAAVAAARLEVSIAERDHALAIHDYETQRRTLDELRVCAPFDGYIAEHIAEVGDTIEPDRGILTIVQLDPLQVSFDCPISLLPELAAGDRVPLEPLDSCWPARVGVVRHVNRVADAGSQTAKIKLDVPNADHVWISGMKVRVNLAARQAKSGPDAAPVARSSPQIPKPAAQ